MNAVDTLVLLAPRSSMRVAEWTARWVLWKMEMGRKGRVSFVPSSPLLLLYKGDLKPYFRLFRYYFFRTLKKIKNKNFTFYFLSTTSFFDDLRVTFCDPLSFTSPSCCKFINFSSFRLVLSLYFSS